MASTNHTTNYNLPQWERTDSFKMEDFNDAFSKIDTQIKATNTALANGVKLDVRTYTGNGTAGSSNRNTITFPFQPKAVAIAKKTDTANGAGGYTDGLWLYGTAGGGAIVGNTWYANALTWNGSTLSWYVTSSGTQNVRGQLNMSGEEYIVFAIG